MLVVYTFMAIMKWKKVCYSKSSSYPLPICLISMYNIVLSHLEFEMIRVLEDDFTVSWAPAEAFPMGPSAQAPGLLHRPSVP